MLNVMRLTTSTLRTDTVPTVTVPTINLSTKESASSVNLKAAFFVRTSHIVWIVTSPANTTLKILHAPTATSKLMSSWWDQTVSLVKSKDAWIVKV